jgi:hypothetical protein
MYIVPPICIFDMHHYTTIRLIVYIVSKSCSDQWKDVCIFVQIKHVPNEKLVMDFEACVLQPIPQFVNIILPLLVI